jgi:hypothetical protein
MSTLELKKNLIQRIVEIDDIAFLKAIKKILDSKTSSEVIALTPEIRNEIEASQKEIDKGLLISNEELEKEIEEWLKIK